ncbi:MAG: hypothetical protein AAF449_19495 [Myxococcota bacterium]
MNNSSKTGRRLELIDYPEDEELVDHRGRSKPIYKPTTPRPREWRPGSMARVMLGLMPGLRLMVARSVPAGLPYALLGLLTMLSALSIIVNWPVAVDTIQQLRIHPRWMLLRAGAVLALLMIYELLRFGAAIEEARRGPYAPRILAALALPSFCVVLAAPSFVYLAPRTLESLWFCAVILAIGATPAAAACVMDNVSAAHHTRLRWIAACILGALIIAVFALPAAGFPLFADLDKAAYAAGFRVLPKLVP